MGNLERGKQWKSKRLASDGCNRRVDRHFWIDPNAESRPAEMTTIRVERYCFSHSFR